MRRQELMDTLHIPTRTEVREELSDPLANVVFDQCHESLKEYFGLDHPIKGPGNELWISPSDLLIGKVCLKPPLTSKCLQALTHQGILEIGAREEVKFRKEMQAKQELAVAEKEEFLQRLFEVQKAQLVEHIIDEEHAKHIAAMEGIEDYYEDYIREVIDSMESKIDELETHYQTKNATLSAICEGSLQAEIDAVVKKMTEQLLEKLEEQEKVLVDIFKNQIRNLETKRKYAVEFEKVKCKEELLQLKHSLECKNLSNLMFILCYERRKCKQEKDAMFRKYSEEIEDLQISLEIQKDTIEGLAEERDEKTNKSDIREKCLIEVIKQFQKFINYALKASPTQAEFLLSMDKLMSFELKDYCISKSTSDVESSGSYEQAEEIPLSNTETKEGPSSISIEENVTSVSKIMRPSHLEGEPESDVLPAFYFNSNMYVREDFRDRFANGLAMSSSHELWNQDVKELMNIFKIPVSRERAEERSEIITSKKSLYSEHSVRFDKSKDEDPNKNMNNSNPQPEDASSYVMSVMSPSNSEGKAPKPERRQSLLLAARDSIELITNPSLKSFSKGHIDREHASTSKKLKGTRSKSHECVISLKEASAARRNSLQNEEFANLDEINEHATDKACERTQSKLTLARDSVIMRIASVHKKPQHSADDSKMNFFESKHTSSISIDQSAYAEDEDSTVVPAEAMALKSSKLLLTCDSVELVRSVSRTSTGHIQRRVSSTSDQNSEAVVKVYPQTGRKSIVCFDPRPNILKTVTTQAGASTSKTVPKHNGKKKKNGEKRTEKSIVQGNRNSKEHLQTVEEFTTERVHSLINLIKDSPSLIRLFSGTQ